MGLDTIQGSDASKLNGKVSFYKREARHLPDCPLTWLLWG